MNDCPTDPEPLGPEPRTFSGPPSAASPGRFRPQEAPLGVSVSAGAFDRPREVRLAPGRVSWLRLAPKDNSGRTWTVAELAAAATQNGFQLVPFGMGRGAYSVGLLAGQDGFGTWVTQGRGLTLWTSFVFRTGEVWGVDAITMNTDREVIRFDAAAMAATLACYRELLVRLGARGPYRWIAGMEGTANRSLAPATATLHAPEGYASAELITARGELEEDQDAADAARAYFFAIRAACGLGLQL